MPQPRRKPQGAGQIIIIKRLLIVSAALKLPLAFNCDAHYIKKMIKITQITQKVDTQQRVQD
jgi:hypothetical protein